MWLSVCHDTSYSYLAIRFSKLLSVLPENTPILEKQFTPREVGETVLQRDWKRVLQDWERWSCKQSLKVEHCSISYVCMKYTTMSFKSQTIYDEIKHLMSMSDLYLNVIDVNTVCK